ncbi:hypothetical protein SAMN05216359_1113 [Roseateles sp. YR242]|nr:hypothetical protein SAMN05216359_1113 [Roseateles sp. YR242]
MVFAVAHQVGQAGTNGTVEVSDIVAYDSDGNQIGYQAIPNSTGAPSTGYSGGTGLGGNVGPIGGGSGGGGSIGGGGGTISTGPVKAIDP